MKGKAGLIVLLGILLLTPLVVRAEEIKAPEVFKNGKWKYIGETSAIQTGGSLQSMCSTRDFIICCENTDNKSTEPDTLIAFYKNDYDLAGNPVEQYSYAMHMTEMDCEHANGMAYNSKENKILIATGTVIEHENKGCIYILSGATLEFEQKIKVVDDGQIDGIAYWEETDQYVMLFRNDKEFKFILTDSQFQIIDTIMFGNTSAGNKFQEFCVSGNSIIRLPYMKKTGQEDMIQIYSIPQRKLVGSYPLVLTETEGAIEPESICEISKGHFLIGAILKDPKRVGLYSIQVPIIYNIQTSIENGTITKGNDNIEYGDKYKVKYTPDENYEVSQIKIDGKDVDIRKYSQKYTFEDIQEDHDINVVCTEIPEYTINTEAENGSIGPAQTIRRDKDGMVSYKPNEHYELRRIYVDEKPVDISDYETQYTFDNIQENHSILVKFAEIPQYKITTKVVNGYINDKDIHVYRDENYKVEFEPKPDYILKKIIVDGDEQSVKKGENINSYKFISVVSAHNIKVIYQWKYKTLVIVMGIGWGVWFGLYMFNLRLQRKRKRLRKKKA